LSGCSSEEPFLIFLWHALISQVFQRFVSGPVYERVIVAAQLRAGLQDKTLSQSDEIIAQGVVALRSLPDQNKLSLHTVRMAKAYFEYSGASAPERARETLAEVEPLPKKQFEALRGSPDSRGQ
jgi:hypothetical protein